MKQIAIRASVIFFMPVQAVCSSETSVDFNGLHGVISQKLELFITAAVRTSNPTSMHTYTALKCVIETKNRIKGVPTQTVDF
jgi:hypothetical protein